jgi:hypothetical protein
MARSRFRKGSAPARRTASNAAQPASRRPTGAIRLPLRSKGVRPKFYDTAGVDQLYGIVTALTAELSVAFDRLDALERILVGSGKLTAGALAAYVPDAAAATTRAEQREALITRVFAVLEVGAGER